MFTLPAQSSSCPLLSPYTVTLNKAIHTTPFTRNVKDFSVLALMDIGVVLQFSLDAGLYIIVP